MSHRLPAVVLAVASTLAVVAIVLALPGQRVEAHGDPLAELASTAGVIADAIEAGGSGPSTAQITTFGMAAMAVVGDAPNHPECPTMGSLGDKCR